MFNSSFDKYNITINNNRLNIKSHKTIENIYNKTTEYYMISIDSDMINIELVMGLYTIDKLIEAKL